MQFVPDIAALNYIVVINTLRREVCTDHRNLRMFCWLGSAPPERHPDGDRMVQVANFFDHELDHAYPTSIDMIVAAFEEKFGERAGEVAANQLELATTDTVGVWLEIARRLGRPKRWLALDVSLFN